jgi:hypothetical protein
MQGPGADAGDRWCETSLAQLARLRSAPLGGRQWRTTAVEDLVSLIRVESAGGDADDPAAADDMPDFVVTFGDELAHGYGDGVVATLGLVRQTPGVRSAEHADREVIAGWGQPDLRALEDRLRGWWGTRLSEQQ